MGVTLGIILFLLFLFLLFRFPKQMIGLIGMLILIAAIGWYLLVTVPEQQKKELEESVAISLTYDEKQCGKGYPLRVRITNGSDKTIKKVTWDLNAYVPGYSTDISGYQNYKCDKILKPGQNWETCYSLPSELTNSKRNLSSLEYKVNWKTVYTMD